jgi:hypothetical protein
VQHGEALRVGVERRVEFDRALLLGQHFGVHEGQVEEGAQRLFELLVEARVDRLLRHGQREAVGGEHVRVVAPGVARQLVEQHQKGERAFGLVGQ